MIELTHTAVEGEDDTFRVMQKYIIDPDPYRQAIIVIEEQGEDILLKSYTNDEERAYKEGCDVRFTYEEELDRFVGANLCDTCMVERVPGVPSYLKTEQYWARITIQLKILVITQKHMTRSGDLNTDSLNSIGSNPHFVPILVPR